MNNVSICKILKPVCLVIMLLVFNNCTEKSISDPFVVSPAKNANGFVVTGDGYTDHTFLMNIPDSNVGFYDTALHRTFINLSGDTGTLHVKVSGNFQGSSVYGLAIALKDHDTFSIRLSDKANASVYTQYASVPLKTMLYITQYDSYNGRINGSFNGPFVNLNNLSDTVRITNGRFSVLRIPDKL